MQAFGSTLSRCLLVEPKKAASEALGSVETRRVLGVWVQGFRVQGFSVWVSGTGFGK